MKPTKPIRLFWGETYSEKPHELQQAIKKALALSTEIIHLYPGELYTDVVNLIAHTHHINPDQVILGHGIEGLIHMTAQTFLNIQKTVGIFYPSFFVFENNAKRYQYVTYPCHFKDPINFENFLKTLHKTDLFFLASPNTATGNYLLDKKQIEFILQSYKGLFVVDQCYFGIGNFSVIDLLSTYDNLLIYRGVTKVMGLASIRFGYGLGNQETIKKLNYHFTDIELDPINTLSLYIFKETFPHFNLSAKITNEFFSDFLHYMRSKFPHDPILPTKTTFYFMDIHRYNIPEYSVINFMNTHNYLFSNEMLHENPKGKYPGFIDLTPPPKKYWEDFASTLNKAFIRQ